MLPITKKRVTLSIDEKTVSRYCVLRVHQKNDKLEALVKADLELERKRIKNIETDTKVEVIKLKYNIQRLYLKF